MLNCSTGGKACPKARIAARPWIALPLGGWKIALSENSPAQLVQSPRVIRDTVESKSDRTCASSAAVNWEDRDEQPAKANAAVTITAMPRAAFISPPIGNERRSVCADAARQGSHDRCEQPAEP